MPINNPEKWAKESKPDDEPYIKAIIDTAAEVMRLLDKNVNNIEGEPMDADDLVTQADHNLNEGITGNQSAYVALLVSKYHTRGEDFRNSWNTHHGHPEKMKGVINPAIITFRDKK